MRERISNIEQGMSNFHHHNVATLGEELEIGHSLFDIGYSKSPVGELTESINVISQNNNTFVV